MDPRLILEVSHLDEMPSSTTLCFLFERNALSQLSSLPLNPNASNLTISSSWNDLVKANNKNQLSRRKKRGHEKNSKPNENKIFDSLRALSVNEQKFPPGKISKQTKAQIKKFILSAKINMLESVFKERTLIEADFLETDPEMLSDDVLSENIEILQPYYTSDGWEELTFTLKEKVKKSTCFIFKRLCLSGCIQCSRCLYWLHFKYENLDESKFSENHESVVWNCIKFDTDA
ncbi:unnamed protein product [Brachionus calyciflorus]|uniref:Uncharacterized protein n=1 Tax=Brachionus calyciflorus TaxID=104777 RepID=A0A814Q363_9BILA|nr:unnamed protein product [Brachionus calyciflorus]